MTREETIKLLMEMQALYPNYKPENKTVAVNAWYSMLEEYNFNMVQMAFKSYCMTDTSGFAPTVSQICDHMQNLSNPDVLTDSEAWQMVRKAISNGHYHAFDEFNKLPDVVKRAVGGPSQLRDWAGDENFNEEVARSNFLKTYRLVLRRKRSNDKLPQQLKTMLAKSEEKARLQLTSGKEPHMAIEDKQEEEIQIHGLSKKSEERLRAFRERLRS